MEKSCARAIWGGPRGVPCRGSPLRSSTQCSLRTPIPMLSCCSVADMARPRLAWLALLPFTSRFLPGKFVLRSGSRPRAAARARRSPRRAGDVCSGRRGWSRRHPHRHRPRWWLSASQSPEGSVRRQVIKRKRFARPTAHKRPEVRTRSSCCLASACAFASALRWRS